MEDLIEDVQNCFFDVSDLLNDELPFGAKTQKEALKFIQETLANIETRLKEIKNA